MNIDRELYVAIFILFPYSFQICYEKPENQAFLYVLFDLHPFPDIKAYFFSMLVAFYFQFFWNFSYSPVVTPVFGRSWVFKTNLELLLANPDCWGICKLSEEVWPFFSFFINNYLEVSCWGLIVIADCLFIPEDYYWGGCSKISLTDE